METMETTERKKVEQIKEMQKIIQQESKIQTHDLNSLSYEDMNDLDEFNDLS